MSCISGRANKSFSHGSGPIEPQAVQERANTTHAPADQTPLLNEEPFLLLMSGRLFVKQRFDVREVLALSVGKESAMHKVNFAVPPDQH